jgi:chromosome segregation ATPase
MPFLQYEMSLARADISAAETAVTAAQAQLTQANASRDAAAAQVTAADQQVSSLSAQRDARAGALTQANAALSDGTNDDNTAGASLASIDQQIANNNANEPEPPVPDPELKPPIRPGAYNAYLIAHSAWVAKRDQLAAQRQAAANAVAAADQRVTDLTNARNTAANALTQADTALAAGRANAVAARSTLASAQTQVAAATSALDAARTRSANSPARAKLGQLQQLSDSIDKMPIDRAALESTAASLLDTLNQLRASQVDAQSRADQAAKTLDSLTLQRQDLHTQLAQEQAKVAPMQAAQTARVNEVTQATAARTSADADLTNLAKQINSVITQLRTLGRSRP